MNDSLLILLVVAVAALTIVTYIRTKPTSTPVATAPQDQATQVLGGINEQLATLGRELSALKSLNDSSKAGFEAQLQGLAQNLSRDFQQLREQSEKLDKATDKISTALQGSGVSGDWGEIQLRRTIELAGLTEHVSYVEHEHVRGEEGASLFPDVIIKLPEGGNVIIDAKAPRIDFESTAEAPAKLVKAMKAHIDDLHGRNYSAFVEGSPEFVMLFVPTEGMLATALTEMPTLNDYAMEHKVVLASPMTLYTFLQAIAYGWRQVAQAQNAGDIIAEAAELHDRLATFVDYFNKVGSGLESAIKNFNDATGSLERRVKPQAKKVRELGANTKKQIADGNEIDLSIRDVQSWKLGSGAASEDDE